MKITHIIKAFLLSQLSAPACLGQANNANVLSEALNTDAKDGETVILKCQQGTNVTFWQGPPNYSTYASGSKLNPDIKSYNRLALNNKDIYFDLIIKNVSQDDRGRYKCSADGVDTFFVLRVQSTLDTFPRSTTGVTKDFEVDSVTDKMISKGKLTAPKYLKRIYANENEISVTWQSVQNNDYPLFFVVEYRHKGQDTWTSKTAGEMNTVISGLKPDTEYYIRVFSMHGNRTSDASNVIVVVTELSVNHGVYVIVSLLFVGVAVAIVVFVVYFVFGKGKQINIKNLSCLKRQSVDNLAMGTVQNNFYNIQNNTASSAAAHNADFPVYSSIDRRLNLNHVKQNVSYNISQKQRKANSDQMLRKQKLESTTKQTESSLGQYKTGNNELCYTEVCFEPTQDSCRIRTRESKSPYADIDLTRIAQKLPSDDEEQNGDEDFADIEDVKKMKRKTVIK